MIIQEIKNELKEHSDPEEKKKRIHWARQYQEKPKLYGVPSPIVRKISSKFFSRVKKKTKQGILHLGEDLLESGYSEERIIAFDWAFRLRKSYEASDFQLLEAWLKKFVHGWGACDDLCTHAFGAFIFQLPEFIPKIKEWTTSANRWMRRASSVVLIYSIRRKKHLGSIFEMADALLTDHDIMVQKGYGWMLKEASNHYPKEVFDYVMRNKKKMPRTALRYAIEKLSPQLRKEAMKRE
ncbi:DNA alkylation repair protein [Candidatus Bathyarchaeota archaeon]|nr:DNA alkylation repair protein [Candidatus Bathyarchaeota archaeon]